MLNGRNVYFGRIAMVAVFLGTLAFDARAEMFDADTRRISFQGVLRDDQGALVQGSVNLACTLYDADDGVVEGPIALAGTPVNDGLINVLVPFAAASFDGTARTLGIAINGGAELTPRFELGASAHAYRVNRVSSAELDDVIQLGDPGSSGALSIFGGFDWPTFAFEPGFQRLRMFDDAGINTVVLNATGNMGGGALNLRNELGNTTFIVDGDQAVNEPRMVLRRDNGNDIFAVNGEEGWVSMRDALGNLRLRMDSFPAELGLFAATGEQVARLWGDTSGERGTLDLSSAEDGLAVRLNASPFEGGRIETFAPDGDRSFLLRHGAGGGALAWMYDRSGNVSLVIGADVGNGGSRIGMDNRNGEQTVNIDADNENEAGLIQLFDRNVRTVNITANGSGGGGAIGVFNQFGTQTIELDGDEGNGAQMRLFNVLGDRTIGLDGDWGAFRQGRICADVVVTTGCDLAESFDVRHDSPARPGMVLSIDPTTTGRLMLSAKPNDRLVAGIVSGAGDVRPGFYLGCQPEASDPSKAAIALSGRAWCWVDARTDAVAPGDLLTTSRTPGHAMKATDLDAARGAIIGKAMSSLAEGTGLVLVLVQPQ